MIGGTRFGICAMLSVSDYSLETDVETVAGQAFSTTAFLESPNKAVPLVLGPRSYYPSAKG